MQMRQIFHYHSKSPRCQPIRHNPHLFRHFIKHSLRISQHQQEARSHMSIVTKWPKLVTPTQLSHIIRQQKNPLTALNLFNEAESRYPNYKHNGPVYATMINILANSNRLSEMKTLIQEMKQDSCECKDSLFTTIIKTYKNHTCLDEAVLLFRDLPNFNCVNWNQSFNTLLQFLVEEGRLGMAYKMYMEGSIGWEVKYRIKSLNLFIDALCRKNRSDLAFEIFQEMNTQYCYPDRDSYRMLMKGLCTDGLFNEAIHLLYSMFWRILQKGSGEDIVVYRTLLEALCENGRVEEAVEVLGKVLRKGLRTPKQRRQGFGLSRFLQIQSLDEVKGLMSDALAKGVVPSLCSYSAMAVEFYSKGKIEEGNKVFDVMRERGFVPSVVMYEAKVEALFRDRRGHLAVKVVEEEMVEGNCVPSVGTYKLLVKGLCDEGKSLIGVKYLDKMAKQVGCVADEEIYRVLVHGLCHEAQFIEACRIFEKMLDKRYRPSAAAYNRLIRGLCDMGRGYDAVLWVEEMVSQGDIPEFPVWELLVKIVCSDSVEPNCSVEMLQQLTDSNEKATND